jgi:hypothetical protein
MIELVLVIHQDVASKRLDWDAFMAVAARTGGMGAVYPALAMADMLAPGIVPEDVVDMCGDATPSRARAVVDSLEPGIAHRVERASIAEHFMWVTGAGGWLRQLWSDLVPDAGSLRRIYGARFYRLVRGRVRR